MMAMKKVLAVVFLFLFVSPAFAEYIPMGQGVVYPSAGSAEEIVSSILSNVEAPDRTETGGTSEAYMPAYEKKVREQLNFVTFSSYRNVGDMPVTRAVLGTAKFNMRFWPEVANALADNVTSGTFIDAKNKANALLEGAIPRAEGVAEHAQNILPKVIYPICLKLISLMFVIQVLATFLSSRTNLSHFASDIFRFMFFVIAILSFRVWVTLLLDVFNFAGYLISPWGGQEAMQKALVETASAGDGKIDWLDLLSVVNGIMRWTAYVSIKVLLISRDVLFATSLIVGPIYLAMGYLSLYVQNDFIKGFLSGWLQSFFKYQFWGVFASIAMIGLSIVSFLTNSGSITDPLVIFITGIAFVHAAFNIPKLADNMSAVVISSVVMATISMAAKRGGGTAASATAGAIKSGIRKLLGR